MVTPARLVADLQQTTAYPWRPATVEMLTTHMSWVFLAGDYVVKVKRPVNYGFVDHSTVSRRRHACQDEIRLNRRLSSNIYLDVVEIVETSHGWVVSADGRRGEPATLMRRLPAGRMLDRLLLAQAVPPDLARRLAERLIPFHRDCAENCAAAPWGSAAATTAVLTDNLDELAPFQGSIFSPFHLGLVAGSMRRFLSTQHRLFAERGEAGWVREGHGDLRAEHVCLYPGAAVQVFDCVEFSKALRCADVASDLAFLLMDLHRLGASGVAAAILRAYREADFDLPAPVVRLFMAHRALVRAKVAGLTAHAEAGPRAELVRGANEYLDLATASVTTTRPALIAMTGLSGTGKSTVAARLARALGTEVIASDTVRKQITGVEGSAPAAWGQGIYAPALTDTTYEEILERGRAMIVGGRPAIIDASFLDSSRRERAARTAAAAGTSMLLVETVCDDEVARARLDTRAARGASVSDATTETFHQQRQAVAAHPPVVPPTSSIVQVDTTANGPVLIDTVLAHLVDQNLVQAQIPATDLSAFLQ